MQKTHGFYELDLSIEIIYNEFLKSESSVLNSFFLILNSLLKVLLQYFSFKFHHTYVWAEILIV